MNRSIQRRHFLQTGALAIGALCTSFAGTASAAESKALGFIGKYSDRVLRCEGTGDTTRFVALVQDFPRLAHAFSRPKAAGVSKLRVNGNVVTFRAGGRLFEVENLVQRDFAARFPAVPGNPSALA